MAKEVGEAIFKMFSEHKPEPMAMPEAPHAMSDADE
jgi:hypothetical protein